MIKSHFTRSLIQKNIFFQSNDRREYDVWQKRFWEHTIRNEADFNAHINYIHYNPVKHGYVKNVADWKYSSFHHYVSKGMLEANWGSDIIINPKTNFGE